MKHSLSILLALLQLCLVSCERTEIGAERWKRMPRPEKILVIESLRGHEEARQAKGGFGRPHPLTSEAYLAKIDELYSGGDIRPVTEIWESLAAPESPSSTR
jgi:hypothetical protein